ncbi:E3 ubiquitin-protein ligase RSL1-like isoform X1 [Lycium barbarum]|uniref:E3 ubiquitin-protein ligase RSL1-like isoform X1 n=1 Tax=Lycium barbarum TaxID=112863 RepID=UPI00293E7865|nr:E3 ubiquitin-protein ligase RSL1-like isoform X1 [Lycium barbarum]XP_060205067.1 E3 ubiquitin-protein ligase RSL1-like isoform X1 [Lycium barbarum]
MADIISKVCAEYEDFRALMVSDDECAEELQFQEVLAESFSSFHLHMSSTKIQESPESSQGYCEICMDTKVTNEMFKLENCSDHSFCSDCISQYVQSKIQEHIFPVTCPGLKCRAIIEPVSCKSIIPEIVFEKWAGGLSEATLLACEKFYCPYKDCSELLIYDQDQDIIECVCPSCQRLLCAPCGVPWHTGVDCDKFQKEEKNREDDLKVEELSKKSNWMTCPHCKHLVQKADGCIHITCWRDPNHFAETSYQLPGDMSILCKESTELDSWNLHQVYQAKAGNSLCYNDCQI